MPQRNHKRSMLCYCLLAASLACGIAGHAQPGNALPVYSRIFPHAGCSPQAFALAVRGYRMLLRDSLVAVPRYLTIIDYTKRSNERRLFVVDVERGSLALSSIVAHGAGSDPDSTTIPYRFSNRDGSRATSLGFYLTGATYTNHRPSDSTGLCLFGLDAGYNDAAAAREVVVHYGATEGRGTVYVTDTGAGRSSGCPALPLSTNTRVINLIRGGSVLFIYSDKAPGYAAASAVLNGRLRLPVIQHGPPPNNCSCNLRGGRRPE